MRSFIQFHCHISGWSTTATAQTNAASSHLSHTFITKLKTVQIGISIITIILSTTFGTDINSVCKEKWPPISPMPPEPKIYQVHTKPTRTPQQRQTILQRC